MLCTLCRNMVGVAPTHKTQTQVILHSYTWCTDLDIWPKIALPVTCCTISAKFKHSKTFFVVELEAHVTRASNSTTKISCGTDKQKGQTDRHLQCLMGILGNGSITTVVPTVPRSELTVGCILWPMTHVTHHSTNPWPVWPDTRPIIVW